jgi:hypothetical protein
MTMNDDDDDHDNDDPIVPPSELIADLQELDTTLTEDTHGDKARAMLEYFANAAKASEAMLAAAGSEDARRLARSLYEGFIACRSIVENVWQAKHRAQLTY